VAANSVLSYIISTIVKQAFRSGNGYYQPCAQRASIHWRIAHRVAGMTTTAASATTRRRDMARWLARNRCRALSRDLHRSPSYIAARVHLPAIGRILSPPHNITLA